MWKLYDRLIEGIKEEIYAKEVVAGLSWTGSQSKTLGLAMSPPRQMESSSLSGTCQSKSVKELARNMKSWNLMEAAIGLSALNSVFNTNESVEEMIKKGIRLLPSESVFNLLSPYLAGRKVGVIGHFPNVYELSKHCDLSVLERNVTFGDLPDSAAEYILPNQDFVFITASTLVNKTAPRLLELSERAVTIMLGPSTPLSPVLFDMGVDIISGLVVKNDASVMSCIKEGGGVRTFRKDVHFINMARKGLQDLKPKNR